MSTAVDQVFQINDPDGKWSSLYLADLDTALDKYIATSLRQKFAKPALFSVDIFANSESNDSLHHVISGAM